MKTLRILTIAAVAADFVIAATVGATVAVPSRHVGYSDLKLDTIEGRRTLHRRIDVATRAVCPQSGAPLDQDAATCRADARERALADLGRAGVAL